VSWFVSNIDTDIIFELASQLGHIWKPVGGSHLCDTALCLLYISYAKCSVFSVDILLLIYSDVVDLTVCGDGCFSYSQLL